MTPRTLVLVVWVGGLPHVTVADPRVEVFTDHEHPVTRLDALPQATVYAIDGLKRAQAQLSEDLPADEDAARALAGARLDAHPGMQEEMRAAAEGLAQAHLHYGLDRYPAIVFDGRAVIYGVTDLAKAQALFEQARAR